MLLKKIQGEVFDMKRRLYRSEEDRMLAGILGGVADYINVDSTIVRLLFVIIGVFFSAGSLFLLYIIGAFIIPNEWEVR